MTAAARPPRSRQPIRYALAALKSVGEGAMAVHLVHRYLATV